MIETLRDRDFVGGFVVVGGLVIVSVSTEVLDMEFEKVADFACDALPPEFERDAEVL